MGNFISNSFNVDSDKKGTVYPVHIIIIYWWQLTVWDRIGFGLPLIHTFTPFLYTYAVSIKKFDNQFGFRYTLFHAYVSVWMKSKSMEYALKWIHTLDQSYRNRFEKSSENTSLCHSIAFDRNSANKHLYPSH